MTDDVFSSPEWMAYERHVREELLPMMTDSSHVISLVPRGETDVKFAVELGFSIMLDKPIIAVVEPGAEVPPKLLKVADRIIEGDLVRAPEVLSEKLIVAMHELGLDSDA